MENDENQLVRIQVRRELHRYEEGGENLSRQEKIMLSTIEKALFLKGVNMFETMSADELKILSNISREIQIEALGIEKEPLLELIHEHPTISIAIIGQLAGIIRSQNE